MVARAVLVVAVIVVAGIAAGVGFAGGYEYRTSPASPDGPKAVVNSTLSILGAGTLNGIFPQVARALVNETSGISAPSETQTYEGSLSVTTAIRSLGAQTDVAAVADFRLLPQVLEPAFAGYEVVFASTPEVFVYDPALPVFQGINASNWADKLVQDVNTPGSPPFAVWNASTDPNGYNEIFSLELQGMLYNASSSAYYDTFFTGGASSPAAPVTGKAIVEKESTAATEISTGIVSALITYRAYAVANQLSYVTLDPTVGLSANSTPALDDYAKLSTTIVGPGGGFTSVSPAPVLFAVTVPSNAPNPTLGAAFVHLLLSPQGATILGAGGAFTPIFPGWADRPGAVPSVLAPDVVPPPLWATAILS